MSNIFILYTDFLFPYICNNRNFNPDAAKAAKICIAEVEELVQPGELKPDDIHLPGIYVARIVKGIFLALMFCVFLINLFTRPHHH